MKDKLQSLTILVLLMTSVYLLFLNFDMDLRDIFTKTENTEEAISYSPQGLLEDAIKPDSLAINFGSDHHSLIANPLQDGYWTEIKEVIKTVFEDQGTDKVSLDSISEDIYSQLLQQRSIYMTFNQGLTTLTILNALKTQSTSDLVEQFPKIDSLYISLEKPLVVIKSQNKKTLLSFKSLPTEKLNIKVANLFLEGYNPYSLGKNILGNQSLEYIPKISKHKIEKITYSNLVQDLDQETLENIINKFFQKDLNLIREIKEEGVQTIYVDGERILKINKQGLISYYNPQIPKIKERNLYISLETALSFISKNLGFEDSHYLKEIKPIEVNHNQGFKIVFGKTAGSYKVQVEDENIYDYLEIDVFNNHVRRLAHYYRGPRDQRKEYVQVDESQDLRPIIKKNLDQINNQLQKPQAWTYEQVLANIQTASINYKDQGQDGPLDLYWHVAIAGQDFEFKIKH
ncbi:MAG: hypothetical protein Q4E36_06230 [Bacillota bacterium]|nr:hypothetical protein [Bacillota bacterium]